MTRIQRRPVPAETYQSLREQGVSECLARIYAARDVTHLDQLDLHLHRLIPLGRLGLDAAVARLEMALDHQEKIVVVGDYDCDGATSTALLISTFRALGATAEYLLPNRFTQGYGLSPALAEIAAGRGAAIIVTVDNGIAAIAGVQRAQELGLDVIVTDHHLPGPLLPPTPYIINPNQVNCDFPSKALAGVGVSFYLASALWRQRALSGKADPQDVLPQRLLDLVALGTVADVVALDPNNRRLVAAGLRQIRSCKARPGIQALLEVAGIAPQRVTERDLGFSLGPRINAAGRLEDMHIGVEMLLAPTIDDALPYAQRLDSLNRERREIEHQRLEDTVATLESQGDWESQPAIVVFDPDGHEGVVGLVAGRLRERFHRPALVFAPGEDGKSWKGSARSVPGVHIRDLLAQVDAEHPALIDRFGGHAMAVSGHQYGAI
jgi:single-stranded-DNA-specific exonuclease